MSEERAIRINKVLRELNISLDRAVDFLKGKGYEIDATPNAKISQEEFEHKKENLHQVQERNAAICIKYMNRFFEIYEKHPKTSESL